MIARPPRPGVVLYNDARFLVVSDDVRALQRQSHVESLKLALFLPTRSSLVEEDAVTFVVTDNRIKYKYVFGAFAPLAAPSVQQTNHSKFIEYRC